MDAFEPIRESARQLHGAVVAAGADSSQPIALINAAISELDLELFWLPANDPALKGAQACLMSRREPYVVPTRAMTQRVQL